MEPVVASKLGRVRGRVDRDHKGREFFSFCGIPYAKPPLGDLRFKAPQPAEPWSGVLDATREGDECYSRHMVFQTLVGSEDCLVLNVFTPSLPNPSDPRPKPVMLWIHGGGFVCGSSKTEMYGPDFLLQGDIVLVSINYRLGVLGFLSLDDPSLGVPGNAGLKDMVMALRWVRENISAFNGDPDNVTIFGESAGGAAVHLLVLSPMAKGLFHKAIAQSGCAINLWVPGKRCGKELASYLGYSGEDEKEILKVLQAASKEDLMKAQEKCSDTFKASELRSHGPVVEKASSEAAFLPDEPMNIILSGNYNKVPMMLGYTTREGMLCDIIEKRSKTIARITDFEDAVPHLLKLEKGSATSKAIAAKIHQFYFSGKPITEENVDQYYQLQTDNFFLRGIYSSLRNHLATSDLPIYFYRFSVEAGLNVYKALGQIQHKGVCHADELGYLFKMMVTPEVQTGSVEDLTIRRMVAFWTRFARTGSPNPEAADALVPVQWPPTRADSVDFLDIGETLTVDKHPEAERMKFWDEVFGLNPATSKL